LKKKKEEKGGPKKEKKGGETTQAPAKEDKKASASNPLRDRIFGNHVQAYMDKIKGDSTKFKKQFGEWEVALKEAKVTKLEDLYKKLHKDIRAKPQKVKKEAKKKTKHEVDKKK